MTAQASFRKKGLSASIITIILLTILFLIRCTGILDPQVIDINIDINTKPPQSPYTQTRDIASEKQDDPLQHDNDAAKKFPNKQHFDCAINWIRIPKTASTSIYNAFMSPLLTSNLFTTTYLGSNTCVMGPGDCSVSWKQAASIKGTESKKRKEANATKLTPLQNVSVDSNVPPYFGIGPFADQSLSFIANRTTDLGRCFSTKKGKQVAFCIEYNNATNTMNFGPPSNIDGTMMKRQLAVDKMEEQEESITRTLSNKHGAFHISPTPGAHVGLDVSIYGWLLPPNPMVFSVFRDPIQRLFSAFHYGIKINAGRPGTIRKCGLGQGSREWQQNVTNARKLYTLTNDTTAYQSMLRDYLTRCPNATYNSYTQYLDPLTQKVDVALNHLETHVIVGLQDDVPGSLQRWIATTMNSCNGHHPAYAEMQAILAQSMSRHGDTVPKSTRSAIETDSVLLLTPMVAEFDEDMQNMIKAFTEEDERIYKRAVELYDEQRYLGLRVN